MILHNIRIPGHQALQQLQIAGGKIVALTSLPPDTLASPPPYTLSLSGALAFPGLVNSHDHLDFNLFPQLGNRIYADYTEWGKDIHEQNGDQIKPVLKIPSPLCTRWGLYKNLLNGFTTVVNHGARLDIGKDELITVVQDCHNLHSLSGERHWQWKLLRQSFLRLHLPSNPTPSPSLTAIHIGEGTSPRAKKEIGRLHRWNLLKRKIVGIHGITLEETQAGMFRALVWCPDSNYFLYNRTADINRVKGKLSILFGSDSTLSSRWDIREQLRLARKEGLLNDAELLDALTTTPAKVWGLPASGRLAKGEQADLVVVRANTPANETTAAAANTPAIAADLDAFYQAGPEDILLVIHRGNIRLFDISLLDPLLAGGLVDRSFSRIAIRGNIKCVQGDLPGLMRTIQNFHPGVEFPAGLTPIEN